MKIVLVDDEVMIRRGLEKILLKSNLDIEVVGMYENGYQMFQAMLSNPNFECDVLITDVKMPQMDGLSLVEKVKKLHPELKMIILSGFNDFDYARRALRSGVVDYLLKPVDKLELFELLKKFQLSDTRIPESMEEEGIASHTNPRIIEDIIKILEQEYNHSLDLVTLADRVRLSPNHLSRLFKQQMGLTITDYIIGVRIGKAKQFLVDFPELKAYEIGQLVGYADGVYFSKLFKKVVGKTPKEYQCYPQEA